jgi:hypothetical protein
MRYTSERLFSPHLRTSHSGLVSLNNKIIFYAGDPRDMFITPFMQLNHNNLRETRLFLPLAESADGASTMHGGAALLNSP